MSPLHRREWLVRNTKLLAVGWMLGTSALSARTLHEQKSQRQGRHGLTSDLVVIGRGVVRQTLGRLRTSAYAIIREAPCPVLSF